VVFNTSFFIVFSRVHNNLSSTPKEEGEQLQYHLFSFIRERNYDIIVCLIDVDTSPKMRSWGKPIIVCIHEIILNIVVHWQCVYKSMHRSFYYYIAAAATTAIAGILHLIWASSIMGKAPPTFSIFFTQSIY
jgi:hypothetical protein